MDENFIINKYFKPLSKNFEEALNLSDDAAVLKVLKNKNLVVSVIILYMEFIVQNILIFLVGLIVQY